MHVSMYASRMHYQESRTRVQTAHADAAQSSAALPSGRKLLSSLTRSRPGTPDRPIGLLEAQRSRSDINSALAPLETSPSNPSQSSTRSWSRSSRFLGMDGQQERQPTLARSLIHKSSRLLQKRKSSARLRAGSGWDDEGIDASPVPEVPQRYLTKPNRYTQSQESVLKPGISEPFNFQHLTHTNPHHARALQQVDGGDLVVEFSAMRAAQRPNAELKGIKADDLPSGQSSEAVSLASQSAYHTPATSRPTTPGREKALHSSKSVDSFAMLNRSLDTSVSPIPPPPRRSSRKPVALMSVFVGPPQSPAQDSPTLPCFSATSPSTVKSPASQFTVETISTPATDPSYQHSPIEIAQAVTTPDDTACEIVSRPVPSPLPNLEDVPEEDSNGSGRDTASPRPKALRHTRSFPSVKHFSRSFVSCAFSTPTVAEAHVATDPTLPMPGASAEEIPARTPGRVSMAPKSMHESWEDSIDYCYDYAMEADAFLEETMGDAGGQPEPAQSVHEKKSFNSMSPSELTDSATSSAVSVPGILTPGRTLPSPGLLTTPRDAEGSTMFPLSPSLLVPKEYSSWMTHEEQYHQKLSDAEPKNPYQLYNPPSELDMRRWSPSSGDSHGAPLSKSPSDASLSLGGVPLASKHHRTSSSIGSIPELVRSRPSRDHLAASNSSLNAFNNGLAAFTDGVSDLTSTIDCLRGDLIRAAEDMTDDQFDAISPTLTPPPSRLALRARSSSESAKQMLAAPAPVPTPTTPASTAVPRVLPASPLQRQRANSAVQHHAQRQRVHRTSYSLFPGVASRV